MSHSTNKVETEADAEAKTDEKDVQQGKCLHLRSIIVIVMNYTHLFKLVLVMTADDKETSSSKQETSGRDGQKEDPDAASAEKGNEKCCNAEVLLDACFGYTH